MGSKIGDSVKKVGRPTDEKSDVPAPFRLSISPDRLSLLVITGVERARHVISPG